MVSANMNIIAKQMKHEGLLAELQVHTNSMKGRNVSMEVNTLNSANQKAKSRLTLLFRVCCATSEQFEASLATNKHAGKN